MGLMRVESGLAPVAGGRLPVTKAGAPGLRGADCARLRTPATVGPATSLSAAASKYFRVSNPSDLSTAIYAPSITNEYLAGFGKFVIQAAKAKDRVAREILVEAGKELGAAASAVIRNLKLERETFPVGYVGGVFASSEELVLSHLREALLDIAPRAFLTPPKFPPAVAAARMAHERLNDIALAV